MTNYEKIMSMSIDELAKSDMLSCNQCAFADDYVCASPFTCDLPCGEGIKRWLESEVEE